MAEEFVTIELSKKQVVMSKPFHNEKTDKDYGRVLAPGGGSFLYPLESIKVRSDNPERVYFSRPVGTEIQVQYSHKRNDAPEGTPKEDLYVNETRTWKIEDLKAAYEEERRAYYAENSAFVNMTVPTEWGRAFKSQNNEDFVSVSIPIDKKYYSFVVSADRFKTSEKEAGMSYFGFPRNKKDSEEAYTVTLKTSDKQEDGSYKETELVLTSAELKTKVDEAVSYNEVKNLFVTAEISDKLVRGFQSKDGKDLYEISVPVFEKENNAEAFYKIVVPKERVKNLENDKVRLSLFRNGTDGTAYTHTGKKSIKNEAGEYNDVELKFTSEEVVNAFAASRERFKAAHNDHSLADEVGGNMQEQAPSFRRHGGR